MWVEWDLDGVNGVEMGVDVEYDGGEEGDGVEVEME